jgi:hypothetical protein
LATPSKIKTQNYIIFALDGFVRLVLNILNDYLFIGLFIDWFIYLFVYLFIYLFIFVFSRASAALTRAGVRCSNQFGRIYDHRRPRFGFGGPEPDPSHRTSSSSTGSPPPSPSSPIATSIHARRLPGVKYYKTFVSLRHLERV